LIVINISWGPFPNEAGATKAFAIHANSTIKFLGSALFTIPSTESNDAILTVTVALTLGGSTTASLKTMPSGYYSSNYYLQFNSNFKKLISLNIISCLV
jgi:hypothetical protein